jgi:peptidyl-prolyl cis-trans isomerase SurA
MNNTVSDHTSRRFGLLLGMLLAALMLPVAAFAERQVLDRVIAIVDEGVILQSELDERMNEIRQRAQQQQRALPPANELREQLMESLIVESLQLQMAERVGIRFDDDTLNSVIGELARSSNMSFDQYVSALEEAGAYITTREQIRRELAINEVQRGLVNRRISITDQEIENYLNSEMGRASMAPDYLVDQILVPVSDNDSPATVEAKEDFARSLVAQVRDGANFADVRLQTQQPGGGLFPISGGELGWRKADQLPSLFTDIVPAMRRGEVNEPIRSSNGFHVVYLRDVRGDANRLVNQTQARHIMVAPSEIRTEDQAHRLIEDIHQRIINGESFNALARQYSDDNMSVVAGGEIGWTSEGSMPPDFESVIASLEIGELSEPFRTTAGWHVAEVMDRRERDLSRQYRRQLAENALRERKFELELENWLIELRDEAYVRILH